MASVNKRDPQKRSIEIQKRPTKETYEYAKETYKYAKETCVPLPL